MTNNEIPTEALETLKEITETVTPEQIEAFGNVFGNVTESLPDIAANSAGVIATMIAFAGAILLIGAFLLLVFYLLTSFGLYKLAKHFELPNTWLAWIPFVNLYTFTKIAGKHGAWALVLFFGVGIVGKVLGGFFEGLMVLFNIGVVIWLMHSISVRLERGVGTTILFVFFPYIMLPYLGLQAGTKTK